MPAYFRSTIGDFVKTDQHAILGRLSRGHQEDGFTALLGEATSAWWDSIDALQHCFRALVDLQPRSAMWELLLEFNVPRMPQRIDVVVLGSECLAVIELKTTTLDRGALEQAEDYAKRKGFDLATMEKWLGPNLAYDPEKVAPSAPAPSGGTGCGCGTAH